jgi:hypothetical protein
VRRGTEVLDVHIQRGPDASKVGRQGSPDPLDLDGARRGGRCQGRHRLPACLDGPALPTEVWINSSCSPVGPVVNWQVPNHSRFGVDARYGSCGSAAEPLGPIDPRRWSARGDHPTQATRTCPDERVGVAWRRPSRGEGEADASGCEAREDQGRGAASCCQEVVEEQCFQGWRPPEAPGGGVERPRGDAATLSWMCCFWLSVGSLDRRASVLLGRSRDLRAATDFRSASEEVPGPTASSHTTWQPSARSPSGELR